MYNYELINTRTGYPTLKVTTSRRSIYLHSRYDPIKEAAKFAEENYEQAVSSFVIVGFAFGYHIEALQQRIMSHQKIHVLENHRQVLDMAREHRDISGILNDPRIMTYEEYDTSQYIARLQELLSDDCEIDNFNVRLIIYQPSLQTFPEHMEKICQLLEDYRIKTLSMKHFADMLIYNFHENIKNYQYSTDILFNMFENVPVILVAAGPSLDKNIYLLKECKHRAVIIVVGRAAKMLISNEVTLDFIVITEPKPRSYLQIRGIEGAEDIPVITISTADKDILENYPGKRLIAFQNGFEPAEEYAQAHRYQTVDTGGSVATTAFDIAVRLGGNPIVFVGQDLAYTDGKTHTSGTWHRTVTENSSNMREIEGYEGGTVKTIRNLHTYLRWFECQIEHYTKDKRLIENSKRQFINATEGGAKIRGTIQMTLQEVIDQVLPKKHIDVGDIVNRCLDKNQ